VTTAETFVQESAEREALEQLTDGELLRRAAHELLIAVYVVAKAIVIRAAVIVTKPAEVGVLMRALAGCFQVAASALGQAPRMPATRPERRRGRAAAFSAE
jgi:hypothetical protein